MNEEQMAPALPRVEIRRVYDRAHGWQSALFVDGQHVPQVSPIELSDAGVTVTFPWAQIAFASCGQDLATEEPIIPRGLPPEVGSDEPIMLSALRTIVEEEIPQPAPAHIHLAPGYLEVLIEIDKDHTARLLIHENDLAALDAANS